MLIGDLLIRPYALPLRQPWGSSRGRFGCRRGWLLEIRAEGSSGFGDCAPLPAAGTESLESAAASLERLRTLVLGQSLDGVRERSNDLLEGRPALAFAIDCAICDLLSKRAGEPLRQWLSPGASDEVPVNAVLGMASEVSQPRLVAACASGFQVIKLKVGGEPGDAVQRLRTLAAGLPSGVWLRLDANGAWTQAEAETFIAQSDGLPIESLEEPLAHPNAAHLSQLQATAPYSLARDESLPTLGPDPDLSALGVRRLVLKPAALGGLKRTQRLAEHARSAGLEVVVTSVVESAAGLWPTVQLAAAIASPIPQGLATADWLQQDLGQAPLARRGLLRLSQASGSGFTPAS